MTSQPTLTLEARGLAEVAEAMEWQPATIWNRPAYRFPIWNTRGEVVGYRIKFLDDGKMRYTFEDLDGEYTQPANAKYYFSPHAITQIRKTTTVFVAEGEPDVLTLYAMGCGNALCWFNGASGAPKSFFNDMHLLGVKTVVYIPDRDYAGLNAALKLYDLHADCEHDIKLRVKEVPGQDGMDLNDAYQAAGFSLNEITFKNLTLEELSNQVAMLKPVRKGQTWSNDDFQINPRVRDALIEYAKSIGRTTNDDNRIGIPSFNEHKSDTPGEHASFYIGSLTAKDYSAGTSYLTSQLVELWGIDIEALGGWNDKTHSPDIKTPLAPRKIDASTNGHQPTKPTMQAPTLESIPADFFVTGQESMEMAKRALAGDNPSVIIRNPIALGHELGGYAKNLQGGKILTLVAPSGAGKTTAFETMAEYLLNDGKNIIWWGGEWSVLEAGQRRIQRYGGASLNDMLDDAVSDSLSIERRRESILIANSLQTGIPGEVVYINSKYSAETIGRTLYYTGLKIESDRAAGNEVHAVFFDYIQLATLDGSINSRNMSESAFEQFKQFVIKYGVVGFMSSQVTKEAEDRIRAGGTLRLGDAQYIRPDKANLVIGLSPVYAGSGDNKEKQPFSRLDYWKNSLGKGGHFYISNNNMPNLTFDFNNALNKKDIEDRLTRLNDKGNLTF